MPLKTNYGKTADGLRYYLNTYTPVASFINTPNLLPMAIPRSYFRMDLTSAQLNEMRVQYQSMLKNNPIPAVDLTGRVLGRWHVIGRTTSRPRARVWGTRNKKTGFGKTSYYECQCECGTIRQVQSTALRCGYSLSCGCLLRQMKRTDDGVSARKQLIAVYAKAAAARNYEWGISDPIALKLFSSSCHYCGVEPMNRFTATRGTGYLMYNGIDRMDNKLGYVYGNVVPCCEICNRGKSSRSYEEFSKWVDGFKRRSVNEYIRSRDKVNKKV